MIEIVSEKKLMGVNSDGSQKEKQCAEMTSFRGGYS